MTSCSRLMGAGGYHCHPGRERSAIFNCEGRPRANMACWPAVRNGRYTTWPGEARSTAAVGRAARAGRAAAAGLTGIDSYDVRHSYATVYPFLPSRAVSPRPVYKSVYRTRACGRSGHERHEVGGDGDEGTYHVAVLAFEEVAVVHAAGEAGG